MLYGSTVVFERIDRDLENITCLIIQTGRQYDGKMTKNLGRLCWLSGEGTFFISHPNKS